MASEEVRFEPAWNYREYHAPPRRPKPAVPRAFRNHGHAEEALKEWLGPYFCLVPQVRMKHREGYKWIDYVAVGPADSSLPAFGIEVKPRFTKGPDGIDAFEQCLMYRQATVSDDRPGVVHLLGDRLKYVLIWPALSWGGVTDWFNGGRQFDTTYEHRTAGEIKMLTDVMGRFNVGQIRIDWEMRGAMIDGLYVPADTWTRVVAFHVGEAPVWTNYGYERLRSIDQRLGRERGMRGLE